MLRELIDTAHLEDFAGGLSRGTGLRVAIYDSHGELIVAGPTHSDFARLTGWVPGTLPRDMALVPVPAHDPPAEVAFIDRHGLWYIVAPVYAEDRRAGYVSVGEFREHSPAGEHWQQAQRTAAVDMNQLVQAWERLPVLERRGDSPAVITARWGARQLAGWVHRETRLIAAADQVALVGDIAGLLTGEQDLQKVLNHIVADTARVMQCPFASMRLYDPRTRELRIVAVHNLPPDYVGQGALVRTAGAVSDQALRGDVVYVEDVSSDPRVQRAEDARRQGIVSMLTAGMVYRGEPVGVLRVYTNRRRRFRKAQRDLLRAVAYQAATAVVHAQLVEERLHNAETQRQLELAGDLQARLMHTPPPMHPHVRTALAFHPTFDVAGDFGDFVTLADGRLTAVVGDVVGKGIPASLLMSATRAALRAVAETSRSPGEVLTRLNRQFCRDTRPSEFVTLALVSIDADARQLTYANAGHEPLLILRDGAIQTADEAGLVLGVDPAEVYEDYGLPLRPDDLLLLYTDGAIEARDFADEMFGRERLHAALEAYGALAPDQVLQNIVWDVRRFVGLAEQSDDLTLVALRIVGRVAPAPAPSSPARSTARG